MSQLPFSPESAPLAASLFVEVALDLPVDRFFTYRVAEELRARAEVGHRVTVPFRGRPRVGIVARSHDEAPSFETLEIADAPDTEPVLSAELMELAHFIARYYGTSFGEAAAAMVPRGVRKKGKGSMRTRVQLVPDALDRLAALEADKQGKRRVGSDAAKRVLRWLRRHPPGYHMTDLCRRAGVSASPIKTLERAGVLTMTNERVSSDELVVAAGEASPDDAEPPVPTDEQQHALDAMEVALDSEAYHAFLLLGVTGSGKTEVYLRAIEHCRAQGRQAIVLVPEIALTPQTVRRFRRRFENVAVLHSAMTESDRAKTWRRIRAGEADVVIGPRSAIFAPLPRLGLIVVDEEHESSFKQQNAPRYHARDVGLVRAKRAGAVVILGSATPALESYKNALDGRFDLLRLTRRVPGRSLPDVQIVDLTDSDERPSRRSHFSRTMEVRMREALRGRGQVILLQNRRGFATSVACTRCGFVVECKSCDVSLTYHKSDRVAICHLCGHEERAPAVCPDCAFPELRYQGVGTQTVVEELTALFPEARIARMDSDTMVARTSYEEVLGRFGAGEVDILVGTQMIAKGLDFPGVTLVGIVSADTSLALPDFRATERTFSLVAQVAGRAGRGERDGRVVVQTRMPDHPAIRLAAEQDFEAFATRELAERETFGYAPYRRLLRVVVRGPQEAAVAARADRMQEVIVQAASSETVILGPAVPPVARVKGRYRRHVLVKAPNHIEIAHILDALRKAPRPKGQVEEIWDVDPVGVI